MKKKDFFDVDLNKVKLDDLEKKSVLKKRAKRPFFLQKMDFKKTEKLIRTVKPTLNVDDLRRKRTDDSVELRRVARQQGKNVVPTF